MTFLQQINWGGGTVRNSTIFKKHVNHMQCMNLPGFVLNKPTSKKIIECQKLDPESIFDN